MHDTRPLPVDAISNLERQLSYRCRAAHPAWRAAALAIDADPRTVALFSGGG